MTQLGLWFIASLGMATGTLVVVRSALHVIFYELVSEKLAGAFIRVVTAGLYLISLLSGVGYLSKGYGGWTQAPETHFEWFATFYQAVAQSGTAIFSYLGILCFVCLTLHVGVVRAKIAADRK